MTKLATISRTAMREIDRRTIAEFGIPGFVLMENAGRAVAQEVVHVLRALRVSMAVRGGLVTSDEDETAGMPPPPKTVAELDEWRENLKRVEGPVGVVCGPGNNGGDGFSAARTLQNHGVVVECFLLLEGYAQAETGGDAGAHRLAFEAAGGVVRIAADDAGVAEMCRTLEQCLVVVDAVFGIGLNRTLSPLYARAIDRINLLDKACVAVDIPSGLDADTGGVHGTAILADMTVTFGAAKTGMVKGHGPDHCGRVSVAEIGFPRGLIETAVG
jgi:hydroxyethylthiazole kinase-like uncharacterized protein yjeF